MSLWIWWNIMLFNSIINVYIWNKKQNKLSFYYIFVNSYRSTFPVIHYTNTCMFHLCSPLIDRSISTISELAFVIQLLQWFNITENYKYKIFSMMIIAEICCWIGIISGISYWHAIEESFWWSYAVFLLYWLKTNPNKIKYEVITRYIIYCYVAYMTIYDIPTYIYRSNASKEKILTCEVISTDISLWSTALVWMTGYFSIFSWISLAIS